MKNKLSVAYWMLLTTPLFFGCSGPEKKETKKKALASSLFLHVGNENYCPLDTKASILTWKGSSLLGSNSHTGYVYLSKGELMIENGQLRGGTIEIDMNTIEDKAHRRTNKLVDHLKDPDFFDAQKFPFSTLYLTKVVSMKGNIKKVTGNLTIKGITHPVTFPANVDVKDGLVKATGKLVIDRTRWGVRYKSRKFYALLANQTLSDSIEVNVELLAKK